MYQIQTIQNRLPFKIGEQKMFLVIILLAASQILACLLVSYVSGIRLEPNSPEYWLSVFNHAVSIAILCVVLILWTKPLKDEVIESTKKLGVHARRSSEISEVLRGHIGWQFESWNLTNAERDVALLTIKGLKISEIAEYRHSRPGTIKAHLHAIFKKANVSSRPELLATCLESFIELGTCATTTENMQMSPENNDVIRNLVKTT